jgi:hypothetical protein
MTIESAIGNEILHVVISLCILLFAARIFAVAIAIVTKLAGCGLSSLIFLKDRSKPIKVGIEKK